MEKYWKRRRGDGHEVSITLVPPTVGWGRELEGVKVCVCAGDQPKWGLG